MKKNSNSQRNILGGLLLLKDKINISSSNEDMKQAENL